MGHSSPIGNTAPLQWPSPAHLAQVDDVELELRRLVRPPGRPNPSPLPVYDLVVLGGGTAGLVCAMGGAGLGARVALVERHRLGGDCLNTGCVPSKAILESGRAAAKAKAAVKLGVVADSVRIDFPNVMNRMRELRAVIAANDSVDRLSDAGVDVFFGDAEFLGVDVVRAGDRSLRFRKCVIATGSRPRVPAIAGLQQTPYFTSDTIFSLTTLPNRLLVLGAGPAGCELAQAFARFGSAVTILDVEPRVLAHEDPDASAIIGRRLVQDGVRLELGATVDRVYGDQDGLTISFSRSTPGGLHVASAKADAILVVTGRVTDVTGLSLEAAGIKADQWGVQVDDGLRTSNRRVYAAGDICSPHRFTHAADALSRIALQNALFFGRRRASSLVIPRVTYTDPEVAHVGDPAGSNWRVQTITIDLSAIDRAVLEDETEGFVRVHHDRGRLCGCTIVAPHAGDLISQATLAIVQRASLGSMAATIHPYPTHSEAFRKAGDAYRRAAVTPRVRRWLERYFRWKR